MENLITMPVPELMKKFRSLEDRINFCTELNFHYPRLPGFDMNFFLMFLQGRKKLLPLGMVLGFNFNYYSKSGKFTKKHLYSFFENDQNLLSYLPDDITINSISRQYLISVLAFAKKEVWVELYGQYKQHLANENMSKWENYGVTLTTDMVEKVQNFVSSGAAGNQKPFRTSKNHVPNRNLIQLRGLEQNIVMN